jgi:hypothetical protein
MKIRNEWGKDERIQTIGSGRIVKSWQGQEKRLAQLAFDEIREPRRPMGSTSAKLWG